MTTLSPELGTIPRPRGPEDDVLGEQHQQAAQQPPEPPRPSFVPPSELPPNIPYFVDQELWLDGRPLLHDPRSQHGPTRIGMGPATSLVTDTGGHLRCTDAMRNYLDDVRHVTNWRGVPDIEVARRVSQAQAETHKLNYVGRNLRSEMHRQRSGLDEFEWSEVGKYGGQLAGIRRGAWRGLRERPIAIYPDTHRQLEGQYWAANVSFADPFHPGLFYTPTNTRVVVGEDERIQGTLVRLRPDTTPIDYLYALANALPTFSSQALRHGAAAAIARTYLPGHTIQETRQQQHASQLFYSLLAFGVPIGEATTSYVGPSVAPRDAERFNESMFFDQLDIRTGVNTKVFLRVLSGGSRIAANPAILAQLERLRSLLPPDHATANPYAQAEPIGARSQQAIRRFLAEQSGDPDAVFVAALRASLAASERDWTQRQAQAPTRNVAATELSDFTPLRFRNLRHAAAQRAQTTRETANRYAQAAVASPLGNLVLDDTLTTLAGGTLRERAPRTTARARHIARSAMHALRRGLLGQREPLAPHNTPVSAGGAGYAVDSLFDFFTPPQRPSSPLASALPR